MQKTGGREEVGPVGPRGPSRSTADEAGFPAAARDPHPDRTAAALRLSLAASCVPAGWPLPECRRWPAARLVLAFALRRPSLTGAPGVGSEEQGARGTPRDLPGTSRLLRAP